MNFENELSQVCGRAEFAAMLFKLYSVDFGGKLMFFEIHMPYALLLGERMFGLLSHNVVKGLYTEN